MPRHGNSTHSTKKQPLVIHQEYADWSLEQLESALKPRQYDFAREWLNNGGNGVQAYRKAIWEKKPANVEWMQGKTDTEISDKINGSPKRYLRNALVSTYIARFQEKQRAELAERDKFSYERWIERMDSLSKGAEEAEQYSPAIRAQELIGKAAGHIDSNRTDMAARMADTELSGKLADILGTTAETLSQALHGGSGHSTDDAIDAEIVPDPALPGGSD